MTTVPIQAQSLQSIQNLADNPPRYISRHVDNRQPLKLYIVRVPASQDLILTTLKPRSSVVSAEDITSCLYYLRIESGSSRRTSFDNARCHGEATAPPPPQKDIHLNPHATERAFGQSSVSSSSSTSYSNFSSSISSAGTDVTQSTRSNVSTSFNRTQRDFHWTMTAIRRDRVSGTQQVIGQISTTARQDESEISNSLSAAMLNQAMNDKRNKRAYQQLHLEIWNQGYEKFLAPKKTRYLPPPHSGETEHGSTWEDWAYAKCIDSAITTQHLNNRGDGNVDAAGRADQPQQSGPNIPKRKPLRTDAVLPPLPSYALPPPSLVAPTPDNINDSPYRLRQNGQPPDMVSAHNGKFTKQHSLETPQHQPNPVDCPGTHHEPSSTFIRTLNLEGDGFWKTSSKRLSRFVETHKRTKSSPDINAEPQLHEDTKRAMAQMGIPCDDMATTSQKSEEFKLKGYTFDPPTEGGGRCEFDSNPGGRKVRLKLHLPPTDIDQRKPETVLLATISFQSPDNALSAPSDDTRRSPSPSKNEFKAKLKNKLRPLSKRTGSWTEYVEDDGESGKNKAKLGSLTVEAEGAEWLDLVVVASMGVFRKKWEEWVSVQESIWGTR